MDDLTQLAENTPIEEDIRKVISFDDSNYKFNINWQEYHKLEGEKTEFIKEQVDDILVTIGRFTSSPRKGWAVGISNPVGPIRQYNFLKRRDVEEFAKAIKCKDPIIYLPKHYSS